MSEWEDSRPEPPELPDMLSARSYLELGGGLQPSQQSYHHHHPLGVDTPDSSPATEKLEINASASTSPRSNSEKTVTVGHPRKRGRPRLETTKDAAAIEERRLQIRRAQRTYRQKKEATIQGLKTRVEVLEQTLQNVSDLIGSEPEVETSNSLATGHLSTIARTRQLVLAEIDRVQHPSEESANGDDRDHHPHNTPRETFGYHVSPHSNTEDHSITIYPQEQAHPHPHPHPRSPSPLINRLFPTTTIYTYSHQESNLSRRLQRFCLEHTYRWLSDGRSEPDQMARVFGLIPCIHDMPGIRRSYRRILRAEIGDPLEVVDKLPFYKLGGAGTHYPRIGPDGQPIYPNQLRRPGKILRRMTRILQRGGIQDWDEDWSGNFEPPNNGDDGILAMSDADYLRLLDLDGEWFDCHDVQGYLADRGVTLGGSSTMWMEVPASTVGLLYGLSPDLSASQYYVSPVEMGATQYLGSSHYVLDVESFFELLLANLRILGRAPGFRQGDVDAALRTAIHRRSST
ncbi:hypothetical protein N7481_010767 [Penicillium waksmanii]|uniref:uncharacterized protein n=1 Tax=Penicillium waksmanii TaxID=69791 RepID=UPI0025468479|nr:uncharacterized protein N7481_010767 [Penicillium waksmanii]KAJ5973557.1 hypothetical protein N7481_010767 [Penicillium waksmanii]